jgi:hypothetical protein
MKTNSEEFRKMISDRNKRNHIVPPSRKGIPNSEEQKNKISKTHKRIGVGKWMTGRHMPEKIREKISSKLKERVFSEKHRKNISLSKMKEKHHLWKGGITPIRQKIENSLQYKQWRQNIFIRDNFTCKKCGELGGILNVHHKNKTFSELMEEARQNLPLLNLYDAVMSYIPFWDSDNGITLCVKDHKKEHVRNQK